MSGGMRQSGSWMFMLHGSPFLEELRAGHPRGDHQFGSINWVMGMAQRSTSSSALTFRTMLSLEPLTVGRCGYPNLLQTGEACRGAALHDVQHPHDLFMEVAVDYRHALARPSRSISTEARRESRRWDRSRFRTDHRRR